MKVHHSALKHGISAEDAAHAAKQYIYTAALDEEHPSREFRLGFDTSGRLLELFVLGGVVEQPAAFQPVNVSDILSIEFDIEMQVLALTVWV